MTKKTNYIEITEADMNKVHGGILALGLGGNDQFKINSLQQDAGNGLISTGQEGNDLLIGGAGRDY